MPHDTGGLGKETGWLSKWAFQVNSLAADDIGRQAMEDLYLYESKLRAAADNCLNAGRVAKYTYNFAAQGGAVSSIVLTGTALPANAIIIGGLVEVLTLVAGALGTTGALQVEGADDLIAATVVSGAPWSTTGRKAIIPVFSAATAVKTTAARTPVFVVGTDPVTAGKFNLFLSYVVSD